MEGGKGVAGGVGRAVGGRFRGMNGGGVTKRMEEGGGW